MKWPWRKHKPAKMGKVDTVLPEALALCISRLLEEKKTQCEYNGIPFKGMTLEDISKEVCSRMGNDWTVDKLKKSGLKM